MGLFKTVGTFEKYVHTLLGNDLTGDGSRSNPYATIAKAGVANKLLNGISYENLANSQVYAIRGDTSESGLIYAVSDTSNYSSAYGIKLLSAAFTGNTAYCVILGTYSMKYTGSVPNSFGGNGYNFATYAFIYSNQPNETNDTILDARNYCTSTCNINNSIIVNSVNLYNFTSRSTTTAYPVFRNCLFRKSTLWKWNATTITINWVTNPNTSVTYTTETLMERVYQSLVYYANSLGAGTDKTYFQYILATMDRMFPNCVVWDDSDTVNNPIFSRYVDGIPVDFTLALKSNNPSLYMSTIASYVGCYAANVNGDNGNALTFGAIKHVDTTTGLDTATSPDLLIQDSSNPAKFSAAQSSLQLWNRIRTSVVSYPRGKSFSGMQSQLDSGIASRLFFGKRQQIITSGDISQKTTAFESVEVIPYDSIPENNNTTQNTINNASALLPRFSAPFNGDCLMFYKSGNPLLFSQLKTFMTGAGTVAITSGGAAVTGTGTSFSTKIASGDNIRIAGVDYTVLSVQSNTALTLTANVGTTLSGQSYTYGIITDKDVSIYGDWAVTNADYESYLLFSRNSGAGYGLTTSVPLIKYAKFELNLHYDEE